MEICRCCGRVGVELADGLCEACIDRIESEQDD
jgi:hypothetical protein